MTLRVYKGGIASMATLIPTDFLFQLTADEKTGVVANCDHLQNLKFSKALPLRLPSTEPPKRPIGFVTHEDKKTPDPE